MICLDYIAYLVRSGALAPLVVAAFFTASSAAAPKVVDREHLDLTLTVGRSTVIDCPSDVQKISTSNPEIVDAVAASSREILFNAKAVGQATLYIWAKSGERWSYTVTVEQNLEPVRKLLNDVFPNEQMDVRASRDSLALVGRASSQAIADHAVALLAPMMKSVVSNVQISALPVEKQVMLRVRFAEVDRKVATSFGINIFSTGAANTPGRIGTGQFASGAPTDLTGVIGGQVAGTTSKFTLSDVLDIFAFRPDLNLAAAIRDLQTKGLLQILAEPNLVTTNGKEASFLVGGEFPVPVAQGGAVAGAITIQYREFGIRLTFLPTITTHGTIKLHVKPEVSTIDLANSVTLSGFTIPALATRRMETDVELAEGQSFAIAGLIDDRVTQILSRLPGLARIPILGELFKSRTISKSKTELVVLVTPEIIMPLSPPPPKPELEMPQSFLKPEPHAAAKPIAGRPSP